VIDIGRYSIRKKLTWLNLLVSGATLLIASSAFVAYELATLSLAMVRNLSIQAQIVGANCASAVLFGDPDSARNTLSALSAAPNIVSVAVYTHPASRLRPIRGSRAELRKLHRRCLSLRPKLIGLPTIRWYWCARSYSRVN